MEGGGATKPAVILTHTWKINVIQMAGEEEEAHIQE